METSHLSRPVGALLAPSLLSSTPTVPSWDRRTYGLFHNQTLVSIFVCGEGVESDCIRPGGEGAGDSIFLLLPYDLTARPDCGQVAEDLKRRYRG